MKEKLDKADDDFLNTAYWFFESVRIPLFPLNKQKEIMGSLGWGCAWELRTNIENEGQELLGRYKVNLSEAERLLVQSVIDSLASAPESIFKEGANPDDSGMNNKYWEDFRTTVAAHLTNSSEFVRALYLHFDEDVVWLDNLK